MSTSSSASSLQTILIDLDRATRQLAGVVGERDDLQSKRTEAVVEISALGVPRSAVAKLTGLTRGRVQQILDAAGASGITGTEWSDPELRRLVEGAIAARPLPSVGVGVRRESAVGPHLGSGIGGAVRLSGDVQTDRAAIVRTLQQLIDRAREGKLDELLQLTDEEREIVRGQLLDPA